MSEPLKPEDLTGCVVGGCIIGLCLAALFTLGLIARAIIHFSHGS